MFVMLRRAYGLRAGIFGLVLIVSLPLKTARFFLMPNYHIGTIMFALLAALLTMKAIERKDGRGFYLYLFLISAITFTSVFSSIFFIAVFVIPVIVTLVLSSVLLRDGLLSNRRLMLALIFLSIATAGGVAIGNLAESYGLHMALTAPFEFQQTTGIHAALSIFMRNLVDLNRPQLSFDATMPGIGLLRYVNMLLILAACAGIVISCYRLRGEDNKAIVFITSFFASVFIVLSSANVLYRFQNPWYLTPLPLVFIFYLAGFFNDPPIVKNKAIIKTVFSLFLIAAVINDYDGITFRGEQRHAELAKFLEGEGLAYGYASLENSNLVTFLSDQKVKVRAVRFDRYIIEPYLWWCNINWYGHKYYTGPTFLMVEDGEQRDCFKNLNPALVRQMFGRPERVLSFEDMKMYVWNYNIIQEYWINQYISGSRE
jgi:hypothetical protein